MSASQERYATIAIILHWVIALMIIGQIAGGIYMHNLPATSLKFELYQWHKSFGITILLLSFARLAWRLSHKPPPLPANMPDWERLAARATHIGFYVLMIGMPLAGWMMVSASPKDVPTVLFDVIPWPHLPGVPRSEGAEDLFAEIHKILAFMTVGLLVLHIAAALKHHFVNKDDVLAGMLPLVKKRG